MSNSRPASKASILGSLGLLLGGFALIAAVVAYFAGPFEEPPTLRDSLSQTAEEIREAMVGPEPTTEARPFYADWDVDRRIAVASALGGGLAVVLGFVGFARREDWFVAVAAVSLGLLTIVFQLVTHLGTG